MRIARINTFYDAYISDLAARVPEIRTASFKRAQEIVDQDFFGWGPALTRELKARGHEVFEIYANIDFMQEAWARENSFDSKRSANPFLDIVRAQLLSFKPDVLFYEDYYSFPLDWMEEIKAALKATSHAFRGAAAWCGAPFWKHRENFKSFEFVISDTPELIEQFTELGHQAYLMKHAFDPQIRSALAKSPAARGGAGITRDLPLTFAGSLTRGKESHRTRERMLEALVDTTPLEIYTSGKLGARERLRFGAKVTLYAAAHAAKGLGVSPAAMDRFPGLRKAALWESAPQLEVSPKLWPRYRPAVFGLPMYEVLARSQLTFNCHIDASPRSANNMRLYEATGVGACLVTDWRQNLSEMFDPDREVVTYRSPDECISKVRHLLDHPAEARKIAEAGQRRTDRDHTWSSRADFILERMETHFPGLTRA